MACKEIIKERTSLDKKLVRFLDMGEEKGERT